MNLNKTRFSGFLWLSLFVLISSHFSFSFFVVADRLHSYPGPDTSPDGFTITDFFVEGPGNPGQGDKLTFFFVLRNCPDNPSIELTSKGWYIAAIDPEGNDRSFGSMYSGETIGPGQSLIFYGEFFPNLPGAWIFWPSYEIKTGESETKSGPQEWHAFNPVIEARDMSDLTPLSISLTPALPGIGDEVKITLITKNNGSASSGECYGAMFLEDDLWTSFFIPYLDPGERTETTLEWFPSGEGDWGIGLYVDYWDSIREIDENNNLIEVNVEIPLFEDTSLEFVSGQKVRNITQTSAIIEWETNGYGDGTVYYGSISGLYSSEKTVADTTITHSIKLTDLRPSTTYHFSVASQGLLGDSIRSDDKTFETLPVTDDIRPRISISDPDLYRGIMEILTNASDNMGVERTEFYVDDQLVYTDYSPPYLCSFDTLSLENGLHTLKVVATDYSGQSITESRPIDILNVEDKDAPKVEITTPKHRDELSGIVQVTADLSDDVGLAYVYFKVDGQSEGFKGLPSNPKSTSVTFTWDTTTLENGSYRIGVEAYDPELGYGFDVIDVNINNPPILKPPQLKVVGHTITRQDNHFYVSLTLKNTGDTDATDVVVSDYLKSFQPISGIDNVAEYTARYDPSHNTGNIVIESKVDIPPSWTYTYTYEAIPILFHGLYFQSDPDDPCGPSIGNPIKIWYNGQDGTKYHEELKLSVLKTTNGESISASYNNAIKSADYLILTDAYRLFLHYNDQEVNELLSTMAKLARYEEGVLGYTSHGDYGQKQAIRDLIKHGGAWNAKLKSGWSTNGYLLLVGETEIIPAWTKNLGTFETTAGSYTWNVLTDLPYANTYGDESKPELSIGRIVGNNARELKVVFENSLNVLLETPGYEFDRSNALLVSGFPDEIMGNFKGQADAVSSTLSKASPGTSISKINTPDYVQRDSSGKINEALTEGAVEYIFFSSTKGKDIVFLAGHGSWSGWDKIHNSDVLRVADPFGWTNPFIFASSCKTGQYSYGYSLAESFLQRGAVVYLGATESGGWTPYSTKFFDMWDEDEPISLAVKQVKASLGNDLKDIIWTNVYHVYGDAKFGATNSLMKQMLYYTSAQSIAPSVIEVNIPDYEINRINREDHVEIPGGFEYFEIDMPLVPSYKVSRCYPKGYQIQGVQLVERGDPFNLSGLNLPDSILTLPGTDIEILSSQFDGAEWWPDRDFEWAVYQNPENSTLVITVYPLIYNSQTGEAMFRDRFEFYVNYTVSNIELTEVSTDKHEYKFGEPVKIDLELEGGQSNEQDVIINAVIISEKTGEVVGGVDLRTLKRLKGKASYSTTWDNTNLEPGSYIVCIELRDTRGVLLDEKIETIRVGTASGETLRLNARLESFQNEDVFKVNMVFKNNGNADISGTALIKILNSTKMIHAFERRFSDLSTSETIEFTDEFSTKTDDGIHKVVGYVMYEGYATAPLVEYIYSASFEVSGLSIEPEKARIGEPVSISVKCENTGAVNGSNTIALSIDDRVEDEETITLNPNEAATVNFEFSADKEGTYSVEVDGLRGTFTVEKAQRGIPGFPYETIYIGIILGVLLNWLRSLRKFGTLNPIG